MMLLDETTIGFSKGEDPELSNLVGASVLIKLGIPKADLGIDRGDGTTDEVRYYVKSPVSPTKVNAIGDLITAYPESSFPAFNPPTATS